jgi:endonuclease/exonuclease/phosphatase family metal-dependent hydrolase
MKVISYNIKHDTFLDILPLWRKRYKRFINYINVNNPDVIGTQEITRKGKRYLSKKLYNYTVIGDTRKSIVLTNECVPLLISNKYEITSYKTYSLSSNIDILGTKNNGDNFPRICTICHIKDSNYKYLIINTHIDNSEPINKKRQLDILDKIINKEKNSDEYVILMGDFNMTLANDDLLEYSHKFNDPFKDNKNSSFVPNKEIRSLDHIFIDKKLKYSKELIDNKANDKGYVSDHYPLICEINNR